MTIGILLCSDIFGRIDFLGRDLEYLNRKGLFIEELDRSPQLSADRVRRAARNSHPLPRNVSASLEQLLNDVGFNVVSLLVSVLDETYSPEMACVFPTDILCPQTMDRDRPSQDRYADAHLHSGAAMAMSDFCELMLRSGHTMSDELRAVRGYDGASVRYSVGLVAAGLRAHLQWLARREPTPIGEAIAGGRYWSAVARAAQESTQELDLWYTIRSAELVAADASLPELVAGVLADLRGPVGGELQRSAAGFIGALCLLNAHLRSQHGEQLDRFVDRFDQMGLMRDHVLGDQRADVVRASCESVFVTPHVEAAEFRKTFVVGRAPDVDGVSTKILRHLGDHLDGFSQFADSHGRTIRVSMPVTFYRDRWSPGLSRGEMSGCHPYEQVWALAAALDLSLERLGRNREFLIGAVDVVGNEAAMDNWCFVPILGDLGTTNGEQPPVVRSVHAGEFFAWRLQGLRSIGQLLLPDVVVERIGHCLALDSELGMVAPNQFPTSVTVRDAIEDLCWLVNAEIGGDEPLDRIEALVRLCGLSGFAVKGEHLVKAWNDRRSIAGLARHGVCGAGRRVSSEWPSNAIPEQDFLRASPATRALIALMYRGLGALTLLDSSLGTESAEYLAWASNPRLLETCEGVIVDRMVSSGIVVESCPTSNAILSNARHERLAVGRFVERGLLVSVNSDDPLVFGTDILNEARIVARYFPESFESILATSISYCSPMSPELSGDELRALSTWVRDLVGDPTHPDLGTK